MARRRYISTDISVDTRVNRLAQQYGDFAALLYTWMIPHADDQGSLTADPEQLLFTVLPGRRDKSIDDVANAILGMLELGLIETHDDVLIFPPKDWEQTKGNSALHPIRIAWNAMRNQIAPAILKRDGYCCLACGARRQLTVDHTIAIANGGTNDTTNLRTLCRPCNSRKGAR